MNTTALEQQQTLLAQQVVIQPFQVADNTLILSLDVQYEGDIAFVAGDVQYLGGEVAGQFTARTTVSFPYLPAFFAFREGPVLVGFIKHFLQNQQLVPDLILIDGHGRAHPRRLGVASWVGVALNMPIVGCAKDSLLPYSGELGQEKGSFLPILLGEETVGYALRAVTSVKPIFVSAGHRTDLETSKNIIEKLEGSYRVPDCLRRADQVARRYQKGERGADFQDLGQFSIKV
jgi:deoxyribonuclease V